MHSHKGFSAMLQVDVSTFVDARGRTKQFLATRCPNPACAGSMIIALRGLEPAHFTQLQALELVELLRAGPKASALRPSPMQSGRVFVVKELDAGGGRYVLGYNLEGLCDFLLAGGPVENVPHGMSALLSPEHRVKIADVVERELAINTGDLAGRTGARA